MLLISILVFILHNRVRELDYLKLNPSDQERKNVEQVINHSKDNTNANNINGKSEISVITNFVYDFENINNSAMKGTDNMKEIIDKNVHMESNKQIRENTEKDVRTKEKVIRNVFENCKNTSLEKTSENDKTNFKCNF